MSNKTLVIIGSGGQFNSIKNVTDRLGIRVTCIDFKEASSLRKNDVYYIEEDLLSFYVKESSIENNFIIGIGDNIVRQKYFNVVNNNEGTLINLISDTSVIDKNLTLGVGNYFSHLSFVSRNCKMGDNNIINSSSVIEHDVSIGSNCHIAPNATICGSVLLQDNVTIGAGSVILPNVSISSNVIIGAGSVITKNIYEPGKYIGSGERII